ncbi:MAG: hypothetical protein NVS3B14_21120 [Ktedonobacteraceae bacterium]
MLPELLHNPAMSSFPAALFPRLFSFLGNYVEAKVASGELRPLDVSLTVQVLVSSMMGFVLRRQILRDPLALAYTHEQIVNAIADPFLKGILAR